MLETSENILIVGLSIAIIAVALHAIFPYFGPAGFPPTGLLNTGDANVRVSVMSAASIIITSPAAGTDINIGTLYVGDSNTTASSTGIVVENNGSIDVNVTAQSNAFFTGTSLPTDTNKMGCKAANSEGGSTTWVSPIYINCYNGANPKIIGSLKYGNSADTARVDANIFVPLDEPAGAKIATLTLTATAA